MTIATRALQTGCPRCGASIGDSCESAHGNPVSPHADRIAMVQTESERVQDRYLKAIDSYERTLNDIDKELAHDPDDVEIKALTQRRHIANQRMSAAKERFQLEQLAITTRQADEITRMSGGTSGVSTATNPPVPPARANRKPN